MITYQPGDRVGDYEIVGTLGEGGMGKVYKVRNVISDRIDAMKVLHPQLGDHPEALARFMREIKLQAGLEHPHIASLRTALSQGEQFLMVMEFVEGQTLSHLLKSRGRLSPEEAGEYIWQTLDALSYAHARGIVHRDIKPANIILTPAGQVKLLDFGVAKLVEDHQLTATGATLGSLFYMSPEQIRGESIDARSDLYSVGISLYEMVTGKRPFEADTQFSIMQAHLEQQPLPPIELDPRMPPGLNEIILVALRKNAAERFQTADAFKTALNSLRPAAGRSAPAAMPSPVAAAPTESLRSPVMAPPQTQATPAVASGKRAIYVVAGSLITVAVLVVAAVQGPKWFGASAKTDQTALTEQAPATQVPLQQPQNSEPVAEQGSAVEPPQQNAAPPPNVAAQPATPVHAPVQTMPQRPGRVLGQSAQQPAAPAQHATQTQLPSQPPAQTPAQPAQQPPAQPAVNAAERSRVDSLRSDLAIRANTVVKGLDSLEREQRAQGLSLRSDMVSAKLRMETLLDQADRHFNAGRLAEAEQALKDAEIPVRRLERFLGQ